MAAMGKALGVGRKQARPTGDGPATATRTGRCALLADGRRKRDHFFVSSFDAVFGGLALFHAFLFLIVGALNRLPSDRLA
jgi:hypothetical protein